VSSNYDEVLSQLTGYGLLVKRLETGRFVRCAVDGDREKRGWYILHEVTSNSGKPLFIGSYGIWQGAEQNAQKITFEKSELTDEQKAAFKKRLAEDKKRADAEQKRRAESAARKAESLWRKLPTDGHADYLDRKAVGAFGVRFTSKNAISIPLLDASGRIHGLQFILDKTNHKAEIDKNGGRDKQFWPPGLTKKGHFHLIGGTPSTVMLVAEGYATAASLHMATGLPVAIAFDANNITPVVEALRKHYRSVNILICADDDRFARCKPCNEPVYLPDHPETCPSCGEPHKRTNAGIKAAELTALQTNCRWIAPKFADEPGCFDHYKRNQGKLTDFNDQHLQDGLHTVRTQIEDALGQAGWARPTQARGAASQGGGENTTLKPINTVEELLERFSLVYGKQGTVFDHQEHLLMTLSDMRDACQSRELHRRWQESPARRIVRAENVGFDPAGDDPNITCNLWAGWPTTPKAGKCVGLLELLEYMCTGESGHDMYNWVLRWLAYPIQHKGAKMRTTLVVHGPQGTGKNIFFEAIMRIYGPYGRIIDQSAIEDKFNDWASRKLFLIADEVVARSDLYHVKNKLKAFITGEWIRINPKNLSAYEERNHVNMVFLSNERMPVVLDEDDRRHAVIWTPDKLSAEFYKAVADEIRAGGIEALHDYLLNLDLTGFDEHTKPPLTQAKKDLISLGKDNLLRFYDEWKGGEIDGIKLMPVLTEDIYELYKAWCGRQGVKPSPLNRAIDQLSKRQGMRKERKRFVLSTVFSNPKYFLIPQGGEEMNPGNSESGWLGQCVEAFRQGLNDYRGNRYG
jgi:putative DNA primase/helicase